MFCSQHKRYLYIGGRVCVFFLIKPKDAVISQIYFVKELYMFRAVPLPISASVGFINLLKPNDIYIYIYMLYRSANLQTLHFKYLFNKYTY